MFPNLGEAIAAVYLKASEGGVLTFIKNTKPGPTPVAVKRARKRMGIQPSAATSSSTRPTLPAKRFDLAPADRAPNMLSANSWPPPSPWLPSAPPISPRFGPYSFNFPPSTRSPYTNGATTNVGVGAGSSNDDGSVTKLPYKPSPAIPFMYVRTGKVGTGAGGQRRHLPTASSEREEGECSDDEQQPDDSPMLPCIND